MILVFGNILYYSVFYSFGFSETLRVFETNWFIYIYFLVAAPIIELTRIIMIKSKNKSIIYFMFCLGIGILIIHGFGYTFDFWWVHLFRLGLFLTGISIGYIFAQLSKKIKNSLLIALIAILIFYETLFFSGLNRNTFMNVLAKSCIIDIFEGLTIFLLFSLIKINSQIFNKFYSVYQYSLEAQWYAIWIMVYVVNHFYANSTTFQVLSTFIVFVMSGCFAYLFYSLRKFIWNKYFEKHLFIFIDFIKEKLENLFATKIKNNNLKSLYLLEIRKSIWIVNSQ